MNHLTLGIVLISAFVLSAWGEEYLKRENIVSFYNCAVCSTDAVREAHMKCQELKPDCPFTEMKEHCLKEVIGDSVNLEDYYDDLCKVEDGIGKVYDCIHELNEKKEIKLSDEQKEQFKLYKVPLNPLSFGNVVDERKERIYGLDLRPGWPGSGWPGSMAMECAVELYETHCK